MSPRINILVVEDHDALRTITVRMLKALGHRVTGVSCAEAVDDEVGGQDIDLLIVDLNLPGEDGLSLTQRIRGSQPGVFVIMTTARGAVADRVKGYETGADVYLPKPVDPEELRAVVESFARKRAATRDLVTPDGSAVVFLDQQQLRLRGPAAEEKVTGAEVSLLAALARAPGQKLEYWQMIELLGEDIETYRKQNLEVRVARLRTKLISVGAGAECLQSVRSQGYQLCCALRVL